MLSITNILVTDNFHNYLNELQWETAASIMDDIKKIIKENNNNIDVFREDRGIWHNLMNQLSDKDFISMKGENNSGMPFPGGYPPPHPPPGDFQKHPPPGKFPGGKLPFPMKGPDFPRTGDFQKYPPPPGPPPPMPGVVLVTSLEDVNIRFIRDSLALYNTRGESLCGPPTELKNQVRKEIKIDDEVVGYLSMRKLIDQEDPRAVAFLDKFTRTLYLIGGFGLLLTIIVSIIVAKQFLAPVKRLTTGTIALAEKKLDTRIAVTSNDELGKLASNFNQMADQLEQMTEELTDLSLQDPLTGLRNRRYFYEILSPESKTLVTNNIYTHNIGSERRSNDEKIFGLLVIDIDFFKMINDKFGHDAGDMVLKQFSSILKSMIRQADVAIRLGGEEFLIALKNIDPENLASYAQKVKHAVASYDFKIENSGEVFHITCSMGFVRFPFFKQEPAYFSFF